MDIQSLKDYIIGNDMVGTILEQLGCHHISHKNGYYSCGNPDGDNPSAISVYESDNLNVVDYTREIKKNGVSDIFTLVEYFECCNFFKAIQKVCNWMGIDYYSNTENEIPESIKITKMLLSMQSESTDDECESIKPISEKILSYYKSAGNDLFSSDNINYDTQSQFEIGYDELTNRLTIPIRDEIGTLVGVKGRLFKEKLLENELKYIYIEPCSRSKILYGLYKTLPYITKTKRVIVTESEKGVMQLWNYGICNSVGVGGKKISKTQIEKITRLCSDVVFAFDKDVERKEIESIAERFIDGVNIFAIIDNKNILDEKESPTDNPYKFNELLKTCCERIK